MQLDAVLTRSNPMKYRYLAFILSLFLGLSNQGCTAAADPDIRETIQAMPSAVPSPGSTWVRVRDVMKMVYVPAGQFVMGSDYLQTAYGRKLCNHYNRRDAAAACTADDFRDESHAHLVTLKGFWIDQTEITNGQFQQCEQAGVCKPPAAASSHYRSSYYGNSEYVDYPVILVTRDQAIAYCRWAGSRLPTESEWEYAARGPEGSIFPWGDTFDGTRLNYCDASCDAGPNDPTVNDGYAETAPVGHFPSGASWVNALDMAGNVREWVADWYANYPAEAQINPSGPASGELIVPRGGSWIDDPTLVRSANRGGNTPDYYRDYYGFRCARD
jgi:formylglycine-generating enzyme required for sulfatase activity